ncbi:MAG: PAS domain S-box protein [Candidatus Riflebacteria bacterium]|nr:PAS domain S-box protein [Candidatus Riflebacteria bacterium]
MLHIADIIETIGDPVFVKDSHFRFVLVNAALCEMLGMKREDILGKTLGESLPKDQMDHFLELDRSVLESGQETLCEEHLTGRGGVILTIQTKKTRHRDEQGNLFLVGVIRDITEQKKAEVALQESEKRLSDIMFSVVDWVWEVDEKGVYSFSSQKGFDYFGPNIIGRRF